MVFLGNGFKRLAAVCFWARGFPSGQRGGTQDPVAQASEGSNPSPRIFISSLEKDRSTDLEDFTEYLQSLGYRKSTVKTKYKLIKQIKNHVDNLWDSDQVSEYIRAADWINKRRNIALYAYKTWCNWKGLDYQYQKYGEETSPLPYIPSEGEIDQLIAYCSPKQSAFLQTMKESAFRPGETLRLTLNDIDFNRGIITLNKPSKISNPRQVKISDRLQAMLKRLSYGKEQEDRMWE